MADAPVTNESTATSHRRSRRELIAGAGGALGVAAIAALGRPTPAFAGTDGDVILGGSNTSPGPTTIVSTYSGAIAFYGYAGTGAAGIQGESISGPGLLGHSQTGEGVLGEITSTSGNGVHGRTPAGDAVIGEIGSSGTGNGVHGTTPDLMGNGVLGEHTGGGDGVKGTSSSGNGIHGISNDLNGVGVGVLGEQKGGPGTGVVGVGTIGVQGNSNAPGHTGVIGEGTTGVYGQALTAGPDCWA